MFAGKTAVKNRKNRQKERISGRVLKSRQVRYLKNKLTEVKNNYTIEFVSSIRIFWYITRLYSVNFEKWPYFCVCTFWTYASNFGLKFCSYLKNNIVSKYILSIFIMMWSSTMNFTPLSLKIKFLWSSENGWNISFCGKIVSFFLFWSCFSYIHRQIAIIFFSYFWKYTARGI